MSFIFSAEFFKRVVTSIILGFCFFGAYLHSVVMFSLLMLIILALILFFEWPKLINIQSYSFWIITVFYPIFPIVGLIYLNYLYHKVDILIPLYPFLTAWTADTFGYLIGKACGSRKICPTISPGKSWEGICGSFIGVTILNFIILPQIKIEPISLYFCDISFLTILIILFISLIFTLVAFCGGLFLSVLKRRKNLKDVGDILPGHGGFLDRFDSVLFTALLTLFFILVLEYFK